MAGAQSGTWPAAVLPLMETEIRCALAFIRCSRFHSEQRSQRLTAGYLLVFTAVGGMGNGSVTRATDVGSEDFAAATTEWRYRRAKACTSSSLDTAHIEMSGAFANSSR